MVRAPHRQVIVYKWMFTKGAGVLPGPRPALTRNHPEKVCLFLEAVFLCQHFTLRCLDPGPQFTIYYHGAW